MEQEMLLNVAKEQLRLNNANEILLFLSFYDYKYTQSTVVNGKKYWQLSPLGKDFLAKGGFYNEIARERKEKWLFYGLIAAIVIFIALFLFSAYRIF